MNAIELSHVSTAKPVLLGDSLTELEVMRDVSLSVPEGEILGLIGPSGSGKSTLLRIINRMEDPTSGRIFLFGSDITELDVKELRRRVGMVSQTPALLPGDVADNIAYGPNLRGEPCNPGDYLEHVGLGASCSEACLRPVCRATAKDVHSTGLANHPDVLLLDEPTSALDRRRHGT